MNPSNFITTGITGLVITMLMSSCGHSTGEVARIIEERDSLRNETKTQGRRLERMDNLLTAINTGIDSITRGEDLIFVDVSGEAVNNKADVLRNVDNLARIIDNQKKRIAELEQQIQHEDEDRDPDENLAKTIANFKHQLAEKDREIASLRSELEQKNVDIQRLQSKVNSQASAIAELDRRNSLQTEALRRQDAILNQCYMIIADKKTLERDNIIKKGKLVTASAIDRSKFSKVDIRAFTEISFEAKRPRILTTMPENSYILTTNGKNSYTLRITNPTEFWRVSNYLVIQTN